MYPKKDDCICRFENEILRCYKNCIYHSQLKAFFKNNIDLQKQCNCIYNNQIKKCHNKKCYKKINIQISDVNFIKTILKK